MIGGDVLRHKKYPENSAKILVSFSIMAKYGEKATSSEKENPTPPPTKKNTTLGYFLLFGTIFFGFIACTGIVNQKPKELTASEKKAEALKITDEWFPSTSHFTCDRVLKEQLKDPDSYRRSGDFIITKSTDTTKTIIWKFRAKNGFGGYNVSAAACDITKENGGTVRSYVLE